MFKAVRGWLEIFRQAALRRLGIGWFGSTSRSDIQSLQQLIEKYREEYSPFQRELPLDSGDSSTSPEGRNGVGVAVALIDGKPVFGVDFRHHAYTSADLAAAERMSAILSAKYPEVMGQKPHHATGHAHDAQARHD